MMIDALPTSGTMGRISFISLRHLVNEHTPEEFILDFFFKTLNI